MIFLTSHGLEVLAFGVQFLYEFFLPNDVAFQLWRSISKELDVLILLRLNANVFNNEEGCVECWNSSVQEELKADFIISKGSHKVFEPCLEDFSLRAEHDKKLTE